MNDARPGEQVGVREARGSESQWIVGDRPRDWLVQPLVTGLVADERDARYDSRQTFLALDLPALCKRLDLDHIAVHLDDLRCELVFRADRDNMTWQITISDVDANKAGEAERRLIASLAPYARPFPRFN